jgi:hypothetical protein
VSAFKARTADGADGIFIRDALPSKTGPVITLLKTGMSGATLDVETPPGAVITSLGIERDGFRGPWLAVSVSMLTNGGSEEDAGWAGIYTARFAGVE